MVFTGSHFKKLLQLVKKYLQAESDDKLGRSQSGCQGENQGVGGHISAHEGPEVSP